MTGGRYHVPDAVELSCLHVDTRLPCVTQKAWLSRAERERADAIASPERRTELVLTRAFVRFCLAARLGLPPSAFVFGKSDAGKPFVAGPESAKGLRFSVSKTEGAIVCAVGSELELGVDVQRWEPVPGALSIARRYFSASEAMALGALDEPTRSGAFLALWVLKEAHAKAVGLGLAQRLDQCAFAVDASGRVCPSSARNIAWYFRSFAPTSEHVLALAISPHVAHAGVRYQHFGLGNDAAGSPFAVKPPTLDWEHDGEGTPNAWL